MYNSLLTIEDDQNSENIPPFLSVLPLRMGIIGVVFPSLSDGLNSLNPSKLVTDAFLLPISSPCSATRLASIENEFTLYDLEVKTSDRRPRMPVPMAIPYGSSLDISACTMVLWT